MLDFTDTIENRFNSALGADPALYGELEAVFSPYEIGKLDPKTLERLICAIYGPKPWGKLCSLMGRSHGQIGQWKKNGMRRKTLAQFLELYPGELDRVAEEIIWAKTYLSYHNLEA